MMDFVTGSVLPWVQSFALAMLPVLGGIAVQELRKRNVNASILTAAANGAGEAYRTILASGKSITDPGVLEAAAKAGVDYVIGRIPADLATKGLDPAAVAQLVSAQLGKMLALDPTVSVTDTAMVAGVSAIEPLAALAAPLAAPLEDIGTKLLAKFAELSADVAALRAAPPVSVQVTPAPATPPAPAAILQPG